MAYISDVADIQCFNEENSELDTSASRVVCISRAETGFQLGALGFIRGVCALRRC